MTALIVFAGLTRLGAENHYLDLRGNWLFEIGDNPRWSDAFLNDEHWEKIKVPSSWENEGFPGYDGYAWYRLHFYLTEDTRPQNYRLELGMIDDVDEVYLNGQLLGTSGGFPPLYETHYNQYRNYFVPVTFLNFDRENVLAVRVFDAEQAGGLVSGPVRLYPANPEFYPIADLSGVWKFKAGDNAEYRKETYDHQDWDEIIAPLAWENQGYEELGGFAWYRKTFQLPDQPADRHFIVVIGTIDDMDQTYLNGQLIGSTGMMKNDPGEIEINQIDYARLRAYYVAPESLNWGGSNVIAVRVYDGPEWGGIASGPLGIISRENFQYWEKHGRHSDQIEVDSFKDLLKLIFGY